MKPPTKYHRQTPLNQRCSDSTELRAAKSFFKADPLNQFYRECLYRICQRHHRKQPRDWRAVVAALLVVALAAGDAAMSASPPPLPPVKKSYKSATITQGAGAKALLAKAAPTVTRYFAVTAVSTNGLESDYSSEVSAAGRRFTLAWDPSPSTGIAAYKLYAGGASRTYTNTQNVGLALTAHWPPPPKTNLVITVTGTNLQSAPSPFGPWTALATNVVAITNPSGPRAFWRGLGAKVTHTRY